MLMDRSVNSLLYSAYSGGDMTKVAGATELLGNYTRRRIRELSILDRILPPQAVTPADVNIRHLQDGSGGSAPGMTMAVGVEPESSAVVVNLTGRTGSVYVNTPVVELPFRPAKTKIFSIYTEELPAYPFSITKVIELNIIRDIMQAIDQSFFRAIDAGVNANAIASFDFGAGTGLFDLPKINTLASLVSSSIVPFDTIVCNISDLYDLRALPATELGDQFKSVVTADGWPEAKVFGHRLIPVYDTTVIPPGTIYGFAPQNSVGKNYVIQDTQFSIKRDHDQISWMAWKTFAAGITNAGGVARITIADKNPAPATTS